MKSGVKDLSLEAIHIVQFTQLFKRMSAIQKIASKDLIAELEARISIGAPSISNDPTKPYSDELAKLINYFFSTNKPIFELIRLSAAKDDTTDLKRFIKELLLYRTDEFVTAGLLSEAVLINAICVAVNADEQNSYLVELQRNHQYSQDVMDEHFGKDFVDSLLAQQRTCEDENLRLILDELLADDRPSLEEAPVADGLVQAFAHMRVDNRLLPGFNHHVAEAASSNAEASRPSDRPVTPPKL